MQIDSSVHNFKIYKRNKFNNDFKNLYKNKKIFHNKKLIIMMIFSNIYQKKILQLTTII